MDVTQRMRISPDVWSTPWISSRGLQHLATRSASAFTAFESFDCWCWSSAGSGISSSRPVASTAMAHPLWTLWSCWLPVTEQHKGFLPGWLPHSLHFIYGEEEKQTIQKWNTCPRGHQDYNENKFGGTETVCKSNDYVFQAMPPWYGKTLSNIR